MSEPRPSFDPSHQLLPLLEATLVQDLPEEPVYDAFPMDAAEDNYANGWWMTAHKYRVIIFGWVLLTTAAVILIMVAEFSDEQIKKSGSIMDLSIVSEN